MTESKAKIFLANERGLTESDWFRTYNMFNAGCYINPHKESFGNLYLLNEETLAPGRRLTTEVREDSYLLLVPVVGGVQCSGTGHHTRQAEAGELLVWPAEKKSILRIHNPYSELIQFIQIGIKAENAPLQNEVLQYPLQLSGDRINWMEERPEKTLPFVAGLGKYKGRSEDSCRLSSDRSLFVYVIQGAFEVQSRLLHAGDGLALWDATDVEWEALSNDAIILLIEILNEKV
ncbi:MAG: hypothetical protein QM781_08725 [Chitinophagaceae bacterium]